jgi:hypothetical protein
MLGWIYKMFKECSAFGPSFEHRTFRVRNRIANHSTTLLGGYIRTRESSVRVTHAWSQLLPFWLKMNFFTSGPSFSVPSSLHVYCPQITSWMRVLRQCTVPRAEVMFFTIERENIRLLNKEMNKAVTMLKLHWCLQLGYESLRLFIADHPSTFMLCTARALH